MAISKRIFRAIIDFQMQRDSVLVGLTIFFDYIDVVGFLNFGLNQVRLDFGSIFLRFWQQSKRIKTGLSLGFDLGILKVNQV